MSKENYTNHNFVSNYGYEIYSETGLLRKRFMPEAKADCEGTFEVDIKDKEGNLKSHEEKPIRSLQQGLIYSVFGQTTTASDRWKPYRIKTRSLTTDDIGNYSMFGKYGYEGGIFCTVNKIPLSNDTFFTSSYNSSSSFVQNPYYDSNSNSIIVEVQRQNTVTQSGTTNYVVFTLETYNAGYNWRGEYAADSHQISFQSGDFIRVKYSFAFPSSDTSTITKNIINDLFYHFGTNLQLKTKSNTNVNMVNKAAGDFSICSPNFIYGASENATNRGIVLGSSNNPVSWEDYNLNSEIATNELKPEAQTLATEFIGYRQSGSAYYVTHARNFKNISDHDITIREAGVFSYDNDTTNSVAQAGSFLLAHWLTGDVVVHPDETIRVYWKPTIIVS